MSFFSALSSPFFLVVVHGPFGAAAAAEHTCNVGTNGQSWRRVEPCVVLHRVGVPSHSTAPRCSLNAHTFLSRLE